MSYCLQLCNYQRLFGALSALIRYIFIYSHALVVPSNVSSFHQLSFPYIEWTAPPTIYDIAHRFLSPAVMHYMAEQIHDEQSSMFTLFNDVLHHIVLPVISITLSHTSDKPYTTDVQARNGIFLRPSFLFQASVSGVLFSALSPWSMENLYYFYLFLWLCFLFLLSDSL